MYIYVHMYRYVYTSEAQKSFSGQDRFLGMMTLQSTFHQECTEERQGKNFDFILLDDIF